MPARPASNLLLPLVAGCSIALTDSAAQSTPPIQTRSQLQRRRGTAQPFSSYAREIYGPIPDAACFCLFSFSLLPFFSFWFFIPDCLLRGLVLLDACVKCVINECGPL